MAWVDEYKLEPAAKITGSPDVPSLAVTAAVSQAISLKRIADALESGKIGDQIRQAIVEGANHANEIFYLNMRNRP